MDRTEDGGFLESCVRLNEIFESKIPTTREEWIL